ncbi:MAG: putative membrane protein, partial [Polaribacter sp.]
MTNSQYIAILEKALAGMDKQSRTDILLEIKSHAIELG